MCQFASNGDLSVSREWAYPCSAQARGVGGSRQRAVIAREFTAGPSLELRLSENWSEAVKCHIFMASSLGLVVREKPNSQWELLLNRSGMCMLDRAMTSMSAPDRCRH